MKDKKKKEKKKVEEVNWFRLAAAAVDLLLLSLFLSLPLAPSPPLASPTSACKKKKNSCDL